MSVRIRFDSTYNAEQPTLVLASKNGRLIGKLPANSIQFKDCLNSRSELRFAINKVDCLSDNDKHSNIPIGMIKNKFWEQIKDFKLVWAREWNLWFEIYVEASESDSVTKNIQAYSLGEVELSQIKLYNIEINTETDIERDDYEPTVLFNETNQSASLLHRITEKAPHYKFKHIDFSIAKIQRTFTFNDTTIYDAFQEISEEIDCLFVIDCYSDSDGKLIREISVYDLESYCLDCNTRGEYSSNCSECGSANIQHGYGQDTTIFISTENLADNITYDTDEGSVKNCFKLEAGDDLMTATIVNCNPNGSGYIWHISEETKDDMPSELVERLNQYDELYRYYQKEHKTNIDSGLLDKYNSLIEKYNKYTNDYHKVEPQIIGYPDLMNEYYNAIDFFLYLNNSLMPSVEISETSAELEAEKLNHMNLSPVAVQNIATCSVATATSAVLAMAKAVVNSKYQVKVKDSSFDDYMWVGTFIITNYSDDEDTYTTQNVYVEISGDYEKFVKQKIDKVLGKQTDDVTDIIGLFDLEDNNFKDELKKYSLSRLTAFYDCCQSCIDILIEQGIADRETWANQNPDMYSELYIPYYNKLSYIQDEITVREEEISFITGVYDKDGDLSEHGLQTYLAEERNKIQNNLDFEKYLGEKLWLEFVVYRREDTYSNDNYISDGLNNAELFQNALEFIQVAQKDIYKSATLQHSITATLKNLLVMKEFEPLVDSFEVGNWLRIRVDGSIYQLRLVEYEINYDNLDNLSIVFSDVKNVQNGGISDIESIEEQAQSMASSYGAVSRQANKGRKSSDRLDAWVEKGLALTKMKIIDNADNQNITWDSHGLLCTEYLPITDSYDDKQLKIINKGLYLTDDNWLTSRAGIGNFAFYNPETGLMEEAYGVIADTLIGNLVLSEKVGVYNTKNSIVLGEDGVIITTNGTGIDTNQMAFTIRRKTLDDNENETFTDVFYIDSNGNVVLNGSIHINSSVDTNISTLDDLADSNRFTDIINQSVHNESQNIYNSIDERYTNIINETTAQLEQYKADIGQYMQFDGDGLTIGAATSVFKTVIDNHGMYFKQGDATVAYINDNQLYIPNAVIQQSLILGNFFFSPHDDGGVSLTWQGN